MATRHPPRIHIRLPRSRATPRHLWLATLGVLAVARRAGRRLAGRVATPLRPD